MEPEPQVVTTSQGAYWRELQRMEAMVAEERARVAQSAKQGGSHLRPGCSGSSTPKTMRKPVREGIPPQNADRSTNHAARPNDSTPAAEAATLPMPSLCDHYFPDEALSIICRFLTARELARLACVSRRFTQRTLTEPGTSVALLSPIEDAAQLRLAAVALTMGGHSSWVRALWAAECPRDRTWRCCGGGSGAYSTRLTLRRNGTFEVFDGYMSRAGQSGNEERYITGQYTISIESGVHEQWKDKKPSMLDMMKYTIIQHIALGLQKLHDMNVLHRDIKANNILLDGAPGTCPHCDHSGNWKICDFGEASVLRTP
eukprot:COSAG02_NODE_13349_length_1406_cov_0.966335_1_plen_314_part_10